MTLTNRRVRKTVLPKPVAKMEIASTDEVQTIQGLTLRTWRGLDGVGREIEVFIPDWVAHQFVLRGREKSPRMNPWIRNARKPEGAN